MSNHELEITELQQAVETKLSQYVSSLDSDKYTVAKAMEYSLMVGGKRIRPVLVLLFNKLFGGTVQQALPFACAIEMIHTYSLIHDDLPCMDDDNLRRGKPSCHIAFGEAQALLAGDALLNLAFETASNRFGDVTVNDSVALEAIAYFSKCSGISGMIGGQNLDIDNEDKLVSAQLLTEINDKKTGALLRAACVMGAITAGASAEDKYKAEQYGTNIGLAFQLVDDILDVVGDQEKLGKPIGSDADNNKSTYPALLGLEKCKELAKSATDTAICAISNFSGSECLVELAKQLLVRNK